MKTLIVLLISVMPTNVLRCFLYNILLGYKIRNAKVGWLAVIDVSQFEITGSRIGRMTIFRGPMRVTIGKNVQIGFRNRFNCGQWVAKKSDYNRHLLIHEDVLITNGHHFDVAGKIEIGINSVVAGINSQFWTHGNGVIDKDITIGRDCYIGTSSIFCPGSQIADNTLVGAGTVITKKFAESNVLIVASEGKIKKRRDT
ncbi:hypothetical protein Q4567_15855 [Aliiglaciecola sp. 2_MG-2023]|uniref:acyltransferase n=1 Tax=unclassified Aliiglaciecola TaxID=2593648 RepID=UPI0026E1458F|nr:MULTISPECIES: hypothetical protein [unclassified Aliiglaciecola]MDO6712210.1 hypothetical protein [Aliiglaciecola sp. 2_MG-2023]MDO6753552.1 hypothetical protein [Aliiglaciecola sp. 1_MG-2023]